MTGAASAMVVLRDAGLLVSHGEGERLELMTSGTSAAPRTVIRSVSSWLDCFAAFTEFSGISSHDTVLIPGPAARSSLFAFAHAHTAWLGARAVTLQRWSASAASSAALQCTAAHLTPHMLTALIAESRSEHRLRRVVCAGARLPAAVREKVTGTGLQVVDYYGAAELSLVAIRHPDGAMREFPGVEIVLREDVIWARSPYLCDGLAGPQAAHFMRDTDGWCTVGDHGSWCGDAGLVVHGRAGELILTGGASVLPADVESVLLSASGVESALVVGLPHPQLGEVVAGLLVGRPGAQLDGAAIRRHAAAGLRHTQVPRRWFVLPSLPVNDSGKVVRAAIRQAVLDGTMDCRVLSA